MIKNANKIHKENLKFLDKVALIITSGVGTMWCALAFGLLALVSLPEAIRGGSYTTIAWVSQTFLQLVLLSIIMVGQNIESKAFEIRAEADYETNVEAKKDIEEVSRKIDIILEKLK